MDALSKIGDMVKAAQFIGQSSGLSCLSSRICVISSPIFYFHGKHNIVLFCEANCLLKLSCRKINQGSVAKGSTSCFRGNDSDSNSILHFTSCNFLYLCKSAEVSIRWI